MANTLKRQPGPGLLTACGVGVGVMAGAESHKLTGAAARETGGRAPLSHAEMAGPIPKAISPGTGPKRHAIWVFAGLAIGPTGLVSAALAAAQVPDLMSTTRLTPGALLMTMGESL